MRSKYFKIQELVGKDIYDRRGEKAWELLNPNLITLVDRVKKAFPQGTMTINNWLWKGDRSESGLRTGDSDYYSPTSQHSLGNAIDCVFSYYSTDIVRDYIRSNLKEFPELRGVEVDVSWLHVDVRNREDLLVFNRTGVVTTTPLELEFEL